MTHETEKYPDPEAGRRTLGNATVSGRSRVPSWCIVPVLGTGRFGTGYFSVYKLIKKYPVASTGYFSFSIGIKKCPVPKVAANPAAERSRFRTAGHLAKNSRRPRTPRPRGAAQNRPGQPQRPRTPPQKRRATVAALLLEDPLEFRLVAPAVVGRVAVDAAAADPPVVPGHVRPRDVEPSDGAHGHRLLALPRHGDHPLSWMRFAGATS